MFTALGPCAWLDPHRFVFTRDETGKGSRGKAVEQQEGWLSVALYDSALKELTVLREATETQDYIIRFGIGHNYINNFKSRVKKCAEKDCEHGSLTIEGKFVQESVKKYFDLELENRSVMDSDPPYFFDGRLYHFEGADGEAVYYAEVKTASREGGVIRMSGELYNAEDRKDRPATFQAVAKPYKWNGKDRWAILSIRSEFK